ncbi:Peptidoglycan/LPS O-acetylase OafA/YrhL, contains acyltransferase and SGNH-hydrolase domains [Parapedobacter luteus]|uniref:Peptidoglycan/LPS O-acetylase OafA/YrhL, contains acyltransferase and SGNH-hydrolase domains n=1 Tax=Parapedobacter luteus TaxID=623280 RepID=A0A1T5CBN6_9SPHI|nr:acyltransferase [Parapedobacter luteus]SKB56773.1 Peptidoglycan/LPS O-acetylase OafA/YrhL, contains acyltransferase and SGNH-hydrolase domains [Parapedobacter luteus]
MIGYWRRISDADGKHLAGLDHLRALAIILVFLCHYRAYERPGWVDEVGLFGWTGVDLFFVLSGYLIGNQLMRQLDAGAIRFGEFYLNRALRIFPAYFLVVFLYFAFPFIRERDGIAPLWQFLTFTQNFDLDFGNEGTFSHAWSLAIEEQFYLLLPLTLWSLAGSRIWRHGPWIFLGIMVFGLLIRGILWLQVMQPFYDAAITENRFVAYNKWIYYPTYNRLDSLVVGVAIASIMNYRPRWCAWQARRGNLLLIGGLLLVAVAYFIFRGDRLTFWPTVVGYPILSVAYGMLVFAALSPSCILYRVRWSASAVIAALSYGIYLCHKFLNHLMQQPLDVIGLEKAGNTRVLICAVVSVLGALLLNCLVEHPFLRWRARLNKRES